MAKAKKKPDRYTRDNGLMAKQVTIDGKRKVFYGHSEAEICQKMLEYRGEAQAGPMFSDVADEWVEHKSEEVRVGTMSCYGPAVKRLKVCFAGKRIKEIAADDVATVLRDMRRKGLATKTISNAHCVLNMIFEYGATEYGLTTNPSRLVTTPSSKKSVRKPPTGEAVQRMVAQIEKEIQAGQLSDGALMAAIFLYTGVRRGECLGLQYQDVDFKQKTIRVCKSVEHTGNTPIVGETKTESGIRTVAILPQLDTVLRALPKGNPENFIVGNADVPLTHRQYNCRWIDFCRICDLAESEVKTERKRRRGREDLVNRTVWKPLVSAHQLRHNYATLLYKAGVPMEVAVRMMGHADSEMIRRVYLSVDEELLQQASNRLAQYLENSTAGTH